MPTCSSHAVFYDLAALQHGSPSSPATLHPGMMSLAVGASWLLVDGGAPGATLYHPNGWSPGLPGFLWPASQ
jgi:hypothetical protein